MTWGRILKAAGRQRFLFSKYNNMLFPGTAWRCGAPRLVRAQKWYRKPSSGITQQKPRQWCGVILLCMCDNSHARPAMCCPGTSRVPHVVLGVPPNCLQTGCLLGILVLRVLKKTNPPPTSSPESLACCQSWNVRGLFLLPESACVDYSCVCQVYKHTHASLLTCRLVTVTSFLLLPCRCIGTHRVNTSVC